MPDAKVKNNLVGNSRTNPNNNRGRNNKGRRKQQSRPNPAGSNNSIRTSGSVISALAKQASRMNISSMMSSPYAMARLTCCVPKLVPGIPDGSSNKAVRICLYAIDRLTFGAVTTATIQFNPWMPTCASLIGGTGTTYVNGNAVTTATGYTAVGFGIPNSFSTIPQASSRPGSTANAIDAYGATSMRIVAQTHAIRYTGPVNNCAGMLRSFQNDWSLSPVGTVTATSATASAPSTNGVAVAIKDITGTTVAWAPLGTEILNLDGPTANQLVAGANTVSCRPEEGMTIRLAHKSGKFESVPVRNIPPAIAWYNNSTGTALVSLAHHFPANGSNQPCVIAYDNDWVSQTVILENVNADASFSIESCMCVEFIPNSSSAFAPVVMGNPKPNPRVITAVQEAINNNGSAVPGILNGGPR